MSQICFKDTSDCADPEIDITISDITVHDSYEPNSTTSHNDIALIRLSRSVVFSDFIHPICLPIASNLRDKNYDNKYLTVAGFGSTEHNNTLSDIKLHVERTVINRTQCNDIYQKTTGVSVDPNEMCTRTENQQINSCISDSGTYHSNNHIVLNNN